MYPFFPLESKTEREDLFSSEIAPIDNLLQDDIKNIPHHL